MAALSALKNKGKSGSPKKVVVKKSPAKHAPAKKVPAKKAAVKKVAAKKAVVKVPAKKDLTVADVRLIISAREAIARQKELQTELETRGVTSLGRIPKKIDKPLVDEARELHISLPAMIEKMRKHGLSPNRILKKTEIALATPAPVPQVSPAKKAERAVQPSITAMPIHKLTGSAPGSGGTIMASPHASRRPEKRGLRRLARFWQ